MIRAKKLFDGLDYPDSIIIAASEFYTAGPIAHLILGTHHRRLWSTKTKLPVYWGLDTMQFIKSGGGQQTTSLEVENKNGMHYTFRSVDKDNAKILPNLLKKSFLRPFLRDQASAINPYATVVLNQFMNRLGILHPNPTIYVIPYTEKKDSVTQVFAGQTVLLEEEIGKSWIDHSEFDYPKRLIKTEPMLAALQNKEVYLDTAMYIKCRLFDFVVSDWDRHEKQWKWGIYPSGTQKVVRPIPIDRDMALCMYRDGLVSKLVMLANNKFQSFDSGPMKVEELIRNSITLDKKLLANVPKELFIQQVNIIRDQLDMQFIEQAFMHYPPEIYQITGPAHEKVFQERLEHLEKAAIDFHTLIQS
ncbi:hypothetical protein FNH22_01835 [Fulvivirga sp. M361]|uniref:hypothetical protein n=1 Tax=Fulvivirga sp. M361 TaxID=2594266 RepID=UPI00117BCAAD|nr:hypothetical protein [Fulvivirga sp. M361]TRX62085.1 hypothetical protein FNH22_01835 [Fulvivirga sp. M361]